MVNTMNAVAEHWWAFALRGVAAVIFGILAFIWPGVTLAVLVLLWGAYALIDGVLDLVGAFRTSHNHRWWHVGEGLVGILAGIAAFAWPGLTALVLLYIIAAWALITGVLEIIAAIRLRKVVDNEWWMILSGVASIIFGIILLVQPGTGALALIWVIAAYAIIFGIIELLLAFRLRGFRQQEGGHPVGATA